MTDTRFAQSASPTRVHTCEAAGGVEPPDGWPAEPTFRRLARAIAGVDARFEHVSVAHRHLAPAAVLSATSRLAREMAAAQLTSGQGGILEALRTGLPVIVTAADRADRFPLIQPAARRLGVQLQLVVPMVQATGVIGALSVYTTEAATMDLALLELAEALAEQTAVTLEQDERTGHLEAALITRQRIGQACGILMSRFLLSGEDAFAALRQASQNRNVKVRELALEVIATGTLSDLDG